MKVEWTPQAEADLEKLFEYIARDSAAYAERFIDRILTSVERLSGHPEMGRFVAEAGSTNIRELIFRRTYRIVYVLREDRLQILAILHTGRDVAALSTKPWEVS